MSSTNPQDLVSITLTHHGKPYTFSLPSTATISDLSDSISTTLSIPPSNQKLIISKVGLLKVPFKDPFLPVTSLTDGKITLMGSTTAEASSIAAGALAASRTVNGPGHSAKQKVSAYKTRDWKKEQEEAQYTFQTLRPLPYLPNPSRSLEFLQRLKDDAGIKAAMRKHKFSVPLLTEMNPAEHTTRESRTLGLNRNQGEVIELRLRTDAYDGYRDYKTIRKTLCHELAHNVWGPHDRNFWNLCKEIEKEVEGNDWRSGGHAVGQGDEYYGNGEEVDDHGGWTGGEFVLGVGSAGGAESTGSGVDSVQGMSRREILAKAAEERMRKVREQQGGEGGSTDSGAA